MVLYDRTMSTYEDVFMNTYAQDTVIQQLLTQEEQRQQATINLIASENYTSHAVRSALASRATDKYAEGYPHKRYYAGCAVVDEIEDRARERCRLLFGAEYVNVQPHAGSQANFAVYFALLKQGDTILGMDLASGGHLTHGHAVNASGVWYKSVTYGVDPDTGLIDYDIVERRAHEHKPALIIAGASAYARIIDFQRFAAIARAVNALFMVDMAHIAGLVAAGLHPSPLEHADVVTSTTHKTLRGPRGGLIMARSRFATVLDRALMPGMQGGPFMHVIAAKAVCFYEALHPQFALYQRDVVRNARCMAQRFQEHGYRVLTHGTDTHLFVVDLRSTQHTGLSAQLLLEQAGIMTSRSCIPHDPRSAWITSGIRIGTAAMTTRGMNTHTAALVVDSIHTLLTDASPVQRVSVKQQMHDIASTLLLPKK